MANYRSVSTGYGGHSLRHGQRSPLFPDLRCEPPSSPLSSANCYIKVICPRLFASDRSLPIGAGKIFPAAQSRLAGRDAARAGLSSSSEARSCAEASSAVSLRARSAEKLARGRGSRDLATEALSRGRGLPGDNRCDPDGAVQATAALHHLACEGARRLRRVWVSAAGPR